MTRGSIHVLGSINVDLIAVTARLPVAGETVHGESFTRRLGGKGANQAIAAAKAGARCFMWATVGDDEEGANCVATLSGYGVDVRNVRSVEAPTGIAIVATSPEDNQIIVVSGANRLATAELVEDAVPAPEDVCVSQLETPLDTARALFEQARRSGATTILNPSPVCEEARELLPLVDILILNEGEFSALTSTTVDGDTGDAELLAAFRRMGISDNQTAVLTLGAKGVAVISAHRIGRVTGHSVAVVDTTGAGDCFCGFFAAGLARGADHMSAASEANAAAALAVQKLGASDSIPDRQEVLSLVARTTTVQTRVT